MSHEPVMELGESDIQRALDRLQDEKLVWKVLGGRATRYEHNLDANLQLDRAAKAVLTLLFLRGAQTPGELRGRSDRLHSFESIAEVEDTLRHMEGLVRELPRQPGQKEARWFHTLSGGTPPPSTLSDRVQTLEAQVAQLIAELRDLKQKLGA